MLERSFQAKVIKEIKSRLEGCIVLKNDPNYIQGFPDLTILYRGKFALLECKRSANEAHQPNQDYYIDKAGSEAFAAFIFPENKEEVLNELQAALRAEE